MNYNWSEEFKAIYDKALTEFQQGNRDVDTYFAGEEVAFLASMGCKPNEVYDFVEDYPDIAWETALLITSVRRDYFLFADGARARNGTLSVDDFPAKDAEVDGIPWLPRLIVKANARLRGQMPKELMYCCGGDRGFFRKHDIQPADFLRFAWGAGEDHRKIVEFVKCRPPQP